MASKQDISTGSAYRMSSYGVNISPMTVNFITAGMGGMMGKNNLPNILQNTSNCRIMRVPVEIFAYSLIATLFALLLTQFDSIILLTENTTDHTTANTTVLTTSTIRPFYFSYCLITIFYSLITA